MEQALGTTPFLRVYQCLEGLTSHDDQATVSDKLCGYVGLEKMHYIPLVHQLIVSEEVMHSLAATLT